VHVPPGERTIRRVLTARRGLPRVQQPDVILTVGDDASVPDRLLKVLEAFIWFSWSAASPTFEKSRPDIPWS
jgi:hypothetical protein